MKDSAKYLKQYAALEEAAKDEIIDILSNNPTGRYIYFDFDNNEERKAERANLILTIDNNKEIIEICGVGLNDDNQIVVIKLIHDFFTQFDKVWFVPDENTHAYLKMYEFVINNLKYAKKEPYFPDDWYEDKYTDLHNING